MTKIEIKQPSPVTARQATCAVAYFNSVLDTAEGLGADRQQLLNCVELTPQSLIDPNKRIPMDTLIKLLKSGAELSGQQDIGLHVGRNIRAGSFGLLGYLSLCSRNALESSELMLKFKRLVFDAGSTVMHEEGENTVYNWQPLKPEFLHQRYLIDAIFSGWVCFSNLCTDRKSIAKKVEFSYSKPKDVSFHQELFGCEVEFSCAQNRLYVTTKDLTEPSPQANEIIFKNLDLHATNFLHELNSRESTVAAVRYHLFCLLPKGDASIDTVAELLTMNRRALQRKLSAETTNFRQVLNTIREELAEQYLGDKSLSMLDIALLLGFSDSSVFTSWFKAWQNISPSERRDKITKQ